MEKKLPGIYANKIDKKIGNNNDVYYSSSDRKVEEKSEKRSSSLKGKNINQKLNEIFNSPNYIYKANVKIELKDKTVSKKIVGKNSTHLITIENELIPLSDIVDIEME